MSTDMASLKAVFQSCLQNSFYHHFYTEAGRADLDISTPDDFQKIPLLSKNDLLKSKIPIAPSGTNPSFIRATSGTSGSMAVLSRNQADLDIYTKNFIHLAKDWPSSNKRVLILFPPDLSFVFGQYFLAAQYCLIIGNVYDLEFSTDLLQQTQPDILRTTPEIAVRIGEILKTSAKPARPQMIILSGSPLSLLTKKYLNTLFPECRIIQTYGSAEAGLLGWQPADLFGTNQYRLFHDYYYEIIDPETGHPSCNGELIITKLWLGSASPLIRYRTGDHVSISSKPVNHDSVIIFNGRLKFDTLKLKGITLYRDMFEHALSTIQIFVSPFYTIHISEEEHHGQSLPKITLDLVLKENVCQEKIPIRDLEDRLMKNFQITAEYTWEDAVKKNFFLPISIRFSHEPPKDLKHQMIIDHRLRQV
jgi:phenylacetate-coenzyme A ligase PaaK-like adenylate-forming protein